MIRRGHEPAAGVLFFFVGVIAYAILGGGPYIEDSARFLLTFVGLTLLAIPIGYVTQRFFYVVGLAPCAGLVIPLFIDGGLGNLWPIAIVFWAFMLLPAFGLSWAGRGLWLLRHAKKPGQCPTCAYDLRGDLDGGCPECGWNRSDDQPPGEAGG